MIVLLLATLGLCAPLTLEDAIARAEEASVELRIQDLTRSAAASGWLADPLAGDPSLRVGVRDLGDPNNPTPDILTRLRFPIPRPWERTNAIRDGEASEAREEAQLERMRADLALAVTTRFHALPTLREAVALANAQIEARERHLALVQARRAEGLSSALDWLSSEEDRRDAEQDLASVERELSRTEAELRALCALPSDDPLELAETGTASPDDAIPVDGLVDGVVDRSPRVAQARALVTREEVRLQRAKQRSTPWLDWIEGGVRKRDGDPLVYETQIAFDIPVYKWSSKRLGPQQTALSEAQLRLEHEERQAAEELVRRGQDVEAARKRYQLARSHLVALQEEGKPMLELADPLLKTELEARIALAGLRERLALAELILQIDQLEAAASTALPAPAEATDAP